MSRKARDVIYQFYDLRNGKDLGRHYTREDCRVHIKYSKSAMRSYVDDIKIIK